MDLALEMLPQLTASVNNSLVYLHHLSVVTLLYRMQVCTSVNYLVYNDAYID